MSEHRLQAAKELIDEKQYELARRILATLPDNATAQSWLKKLDEVAPPPEKAGKTGMAKKWGYCRLMTVQDRKSEQVPITWQVGAVVQYYDPVGGSWDGELGEITTRESRGAASSAEQAFYRMLAKLGGQGWEVVDFSQTERRDDGWGAWIRIEVLLKRDES